ncbi:MULTISPECIES: hypothetical protein [unclassified Acinetobacter]|uniref:hypothetical protein n=1 Tax=unclassified Acinetobacter TaxID=196816 RepID=UPI0007D08BA3|nr:MULTISPECIES: hypothetical protein [unclassified Acinetobacter]OAL80464.1 hypothetical protein AY607_01890 [Acinetobacter sp. SFA]OAL84343.1 hypothetical protein AY605_06665 [Acinetobacter sp. SFD]TQR72622.1 hypothetical protein E2K52_01320 [Acinetobacter sp. RF14B]
MAKKKVNPKWFRHEALHTTSVAVEFVNDHLANHQYYHQKINPKFNKKIDDALEALMEAYQLCNQENEVKKKMKTNH